MSISRRSFLGPPPSAPSVRAFAAELVDENAELARSFASHRDA